MKTKQIRNSLILLLTSLIWGISFVAQSEGGDAVGPYTFNSIRSFIGSLVLVPVIIFINKKGLSSKMPKSNKDLKQLLLGGLCCGIALCIATNIQQLGIYLGASPGKAGFLTACYILIVPILGIFLKRKCGWNIWVGVLIALAGLYLLCCTSDSFGLSFADVLLLLCALIFSFHILIIDHFSPLVDGVCMSCIQFLICGILTAIPTIFVDIPKMGFEIWLQSFATWDAWIPILYAGVFSCGVAYTLQIIGQDGLNPTIASLIMSLESVFSVLAGWIILGDRLGTREILGCILIFSAIVLAQIPFGKRKTA